jgi:hypothetical protein
MTIATYTGAQTDAVLLAVASGRRAVSAFVEAFVSKACTVNVDVLVEFDSGTDVKIKKFNAIPPGGGFGVPVTLSGGDGEDIVVTLTVPTGGDVTVGVNSYDGEYP